MSIQFNPFTGTFDFSNDGLFVNITGDTMTGNLSIYKDNPAIYFTDTFIGASAAFTTTSMQVVDSTSTWLYGIYGGTTIDLGDDGGTTKSRITGDGDTFTFAPSLLSSINMTLADAGAVITRTTVPKLTLAETTSSSTFYGVNNVTAGRWALQDSEVSTSYYEISQSNFKISPQSIGSITLTTYGGTWNVGTLGGSLANSHLTAGSAGSGSNLNGSSWDIIPGDSTGSGTSKVNIWASGGGGTGASTSVSALVATFAKTTLTFNNPTTNTVLDFATLGILRLTTGTFRLQGGSTVRAAFSLGTQSPPTTPTADDIWHDSTQKEIITYLNGIRGGLVRTLYEATATATVASTVTETTLIGSGVGTVTLPANFFLAGNSVRIRATGVYSTKAATAGTLRIRIKKGTTVLLGTTAQTVTDNLTARVWELNATITAKSGTAVIENTKVRLSTSATAEQAWEMNNGTTAVTIGSTSEALNLTAEWGTSDASNTISCTNFVVEVLTAKT